MGSIEGVRRAAAARIGVTIEEYERRLAEGERWCSGCKAWHPLDAFTRDGSRGDGLARACRDVQSKRGKERYVPVPVAERKSPGPAPQPPRDGDVRQARERVALLVRTGRLPRPGTRPCADCGHLGDDRRHEYDHRLGYGGGHHEDVEPVCTVCHAHRSRERGELVQVRGPHGRFATA